MARRTKPEGNKRQRERDKRRKKEQKALRKQLRKDGLLGSEEDEEQAEGSATEDPDAADALDSPGVETGHERREGDPDERPS